MHIRNLSLLLLLISVSSLTQAQGFHIGAKAGANIFKVDGKSFDQEFKFGYNLGAFSEIYFNSKWGIQPEVLWNQTNTRTSNKFSTIYSDGSNLKDVRLNYLSIPVLLNYRPVKLITLQAGPQFGILMDHNKDLLQNGKDAFKKGDFALVGGVQLNLASIKVGGRYQIGLSNINDIDNQDKWKNQGFQLYAGFRLF